MKANLSCCFGTNTLQLIKLQSYSLAVNSMSFYLQQNFYTPLSCDRSELNRIIGDGTVFCAEKSSGKTFCDAGSRKVVKGNGTLFHGDVLKHTFVSEEVKRKPK